MFSPSACPLLQAVLYTSKQRVQDQHEIGSTGPQEHHIHLYCHSSWTDRCSPPPSPWWQWQQEWLLAAGWLSWNSARWELWEKWGYAAAPSGISAECLLLAHVPFEDTKWSRDGSHQDFPQGTTITFPQLLQNGNEARSCGQEEPSFHLPSHYWRGAGLRGACHFWWVERGLWLLVPLRLPGHLPCRLVFLDWRQPTATWH